MAGENVLRMEYPDAESFYAAAIAASDPAMVKGQLRVRNALKFEPRGLDAWAGSVTYQDAADMARNGWREGRDRIKPALDHAQAILRPAPARVRTLDVAGAFPEIVAAIAGDPCCMHAEGWDDRATRPILRLVSEQWVSSAVSCDMQIMRGAAILAHVDRLESAGIRCEIIARYACRGSGRAFSKKHVVCDVTAKRADEPLDIDRLAFLLAHPSCLRRLFFGMLDTLPDGWHVGFDCNASYAYPPDESVRQIEDGRGIILPAANEFAPDWFTADRAVARVGAFLRDGITALGSMGVMTDAAEIIAAA